MTVGHFYRVIRSSQEITYKFIVPLQTSIVPNLEGHKSSLEGGTTKNFFRPFAPEFRATLKFLPAPLLTTTRGNIDEICAIEYNANKYDTTSLAKEVHMQYVTVTPLSTMGYTSVASVFQ